MYNVCYALRFYEFSNEINLNLPSLKCKLDCLIVSWAVHLPNSASHCYELLLEIQHCSWIQQYSYSASTCIIHTTAISMRHMAHVFHVHCLTRNHVHLNGDISWAVRQYTSMDWDRDWVRERGGCDMIRGIASFWFSKLKWNNKTLHYDILGNKCRMLLI